MWHRWLEGVAVLAHYGQPLLWLGLAAWGVGGLWGIWTRRYGAPWHQHVVFGSVGAGAVGVGVAFLPPAARQAAAMGLALTGAVAAGVWLWTVARSPHWGLLLLLGGLLGVVLPWSAADVRRLLVPPYLDAGVHYAVIRSAFSGHPLPGFPFVLRLSRLFDPHSFYHLGFHGWLAWALWAGAPFPPQAMLLAALFLPLAVLPTAMYWLGVALWGRRDVALVAAGAAAVGWRMPLYSLNWGKYPALMALCAAPVVILLAWQVLCVPARVTRGRGLLGLAAVVALVWAHSRVGLAVGLFVAAMCCWRRWCPPAPRSRRLWLWGLAVAALAGGAALAFRGAYWRFYPGWWAWVLAGGVLGWAAGAPVAGGVAALAWLVMLAWGRLPSWFPQNARWLVDRPLFEMAAALPLGWLTGGIAFPYLRRWARWGAVVGVVVLVGFSWRHAYRPRTDLVYVQEDDLLAFALLKRISSPRAVVLTPATRDGYVADGGIWAPVFTERATRRVLEPHWWYVGALLPFCEQFPEVWVYIDLQPSYSELPPEPLPVLTLDIALPTVLVYRVDCATAFEMWQERLERLSSGSKIP